MKKFLEGISKAMDKHTPVGVVKQAAGLVKDKMAATKSVQDAMIMQTKLKQKQESKMSVGEAVEKRKVDEEIRTNKMNKMSNSERKSKQFYK